ncbi:MAG: GNAT family N-acetyltransferase [Candidatus Aenigmatarchaeota archaeon]
MEIRLVKEKRYGLSEELEELKREHYIDVFGRDYKEIYELSNRLWPGEEIIYLEGNRRKIGYTIVKKGKFDLKFRNFSILPEYRGKGLANCLVTALEKEASKHHQELVERGKKPEEYDVIYLRSYIYPETRDFSLKHDPKFEMGLFLKKVGFGPYTFNPKELNQEEQLALKSYETNNLLKSLRVFKKKIGSGTRLKDYIKEELRALKPEKRKIVLDGLDVKMKVYVEKGFVSYKYSLCPVCADVGSSLEEQKCSECYIERTCREPFVEGFKDDNEVSSEYFSEVEWFLRQQ